MFLRLLPVNLNSFSNTAVVSVSSSGLIVLRDFPQGFEMLQGFVMLDLFVSPFLSQGLGFMKNTKN